jgi:hypothetical protein
MHLTNLALTLIFALSAPATAALAQPFALAGPGGAPLPMSFSFAPEASPAHFLSVSPE